jgi:hypothetical protein
LRASWRRPGSAVDLVRAPLRHPFQIHSRGGIAIALFCEVRVEPFERPRFLLVDLRDLERRKDHATGHVLDVRQGQEPLREEILFSNLVWRHGGQLLPGQARRQLDPHPLLDRLPSASHHHARGGTVPEVVAFGEQRALALHHGGLGPLVTRPDGGEVLLDHREVRLA